MSVHWGGGGEERCFTSGRGGIKAVTQVLSDVFETKITMFFDEGANGNRFPSCEHVLYRHVIRQTN